MFDGFTQSSMNVNGQTIAYRQAGSGPGLLLLHGFPQTHAMWHTIAPALTDRFTVVTADLRGYGASSKPPGADNYSFRHMAADQVALMHALHCEQFHVVGHDRGARAAHRMALDHQDAVLSLTLMDIVPTHHLLSDLRPEVAQAYYHWFFLAQPEPFPEGLICTDPDHYFESCLLGWGGADLTGFAPEALAAYRASWAVPETIRAMCDDYRAALSVDFALDDADLARTVDCPALVLFGSSGAMSQHYDVPATWAPRLTNMQASAVPGGHFFPDTNPADTIQALRTFFERIA